jgi:hypothetical protein
MAVIDKSETELMLQDCINRQVKLTDWEVGFLKSIQPHINNLKAMQLAKLEEIWERIT